MALDRLVVITGPSAVGKTTVANSLPKTGLPVEKVVTTTTRRKRPSEHDGSDYHFISKNEFEALIKEGQLIEWAKYNGNYYGSRWEDIESIIKRGNIPLWVTENVGAQFFKTHYPHAVNIFVMPEDFETLRRRLEKRQLSAEEIDNRISIARTEIENAPHADYRVVNLDGKVELTVQETASLIRKHFNLPD